jgi:predicted GTPase
MGQTGSGKSTVGCFFHILKPLSDDHVPKFINRFCGEEHLDVNHGLESCPKEINVALFTLPPTHRSWPNHRLVLVDTPGFDDNEQVEFETLKRICGWLASVESM